jgi:novel protein kinase C epsilon type
MKLMVVEAEDLRPTDFATRHQVGLIGRTAPSVVDPYVSVDIDDVTIARTTTRAKTSKPTWNEEFSAEVHSGQNIGLTVFHDAAIPPDEFVANCSIAFEDIVEKATSDIWVRCMYQI